MKKGIIAVVALVAVLAGATWLLGGLTEKGVKSYFVQLDEENPVPQLSVDLPDYERGFFKSTATTALGIDGIDEDGYLKHDVFHGPLAMTPDGLKPGLAYIVTTLDRSRLSDEMQETINDVYGEQEPFSIRTNVAMTGGRESILEIAAVNHEDDANSIRFDGATGSLKMKGGSGAVDFGLEVSPLSIKGIDEGDGEFTFRFDTSDLKFSGNEKTGVSGGGTIGKLSFKTFGVGAFSMEMDESTLEGDYRSLEPGSSLYIGTGTWLIPTMSMDFDDGDGVVIKGLKSTSGSVVEGEMLKSTQNYSMESVEESFLRETDYAVLSVAMAQGMAFSSESTMSKTLAENLSAMQGNMQGIGSMETEEPSKEDLDQFATVMEESLKTVSRGTGVSLALSIGSEDQSSSAGLSLVYEDDAPLTDKKNYDELLNALSLQLQLEMPKEMIQSLPEDVSERLGMLVASGTVVESGANFLSAITIEDGVLLSNGNPNLLFEQMKPMLMMPIDWDGIFEGIRSSGGGE